MKMKIITNNNNKNIQLKNLEGFLLETFLIKLNIQP